MRLDQRGAGARIPRAVPHLVQRQANTMFLGAVQRRGTRHMVTGADMIEQSLHRYHCRLNITARQRYPRLTLQRVRNLDRDVDFASERVGPLERSGPARGRAFR